MSTLQQQIENAARTIDTDSYSVSIGELMSMYKENEIDIHPEFQRTFRWEVEQKSTLIESILLGIPIPPIFIFMREDGVWDVIDGQQRLSTIFQFAGIYKDKEGKIHPPIELTSTKFLPLLGKIVWQNDDENIYQLTQAQRLAIKRGKIDVKLLKSTSDKNSKYDLFQRLNSGGTRLTEQEIRTCLIIMESEDFYSELLEMSKNNDFKTCLPLTERAIKEQENLEFIVRFIVSRHGKIENIEQGLHNYLSESIIGIIRDPLFSVLEEKKVFSMFFSLMNNAAGEDAFRRYNKDKQAFQGPPTISAFEAIAPTVSKRLEHFSSIPAEDFKNMIIGLHSNEAYKTAYNRRSTDRYKTLLLLGKELFGNNAS
ncbi:MAG: DUF262 domain-containing protein [Defluviitaleaceae bacterium]|nr:DUF262 domain-containing protein [Defluviitaleaceae bacterium]